MGMKAIPVVVRERILKLYEQGKGAREIASGFGYCVAAVRRDDAVILDNLATRKVAGVREAI